MAWKITRVESGPEQGEQWRSTPGEPSRGDGRVRINPNRKYQTMVGFGGAFTEAIASYRSARDRDGCVGIDGVAGRGA